VFAEEDAAVVAPVFVDGDEFPRDTGGEGAEDGFVRRVDVESGGDAGESGSSGDNSTPGK
jgi:hypothetical protein